MEKTPEEHTDFVSSSSRMGMGDSDSEKKKSKKKKKGYSSDVISIRKNLPKVGSQRHKDKVLWEDYIKKHRADLREALPVVDDTPLPLNIPYVYDTETLKGIYSGLKKVFVLSLDVVKKNYLVTILPGKTDTFTYDYSTPMTSNYAERKREAQMIEKENKLFAQQLKTVKTTMMTVKEYADEWKLHENIVEHTSQYPLWRKIKKEKATVEIPPPIHYFKQHITEKSAKYPDKRPRVFLEISIKNVGVVGKMVAMLYSDYVPMTVKNFLAFCDPKAPLTYKGNSFYLIFPEYYCQTGDVVENRGYGGTSIYGPYFGNEDVTLDHAERGVLTMYTKIPNRNGSQFLIIFRKLESLNGQNVVFGKIVRGLHVLDTIESVGSKKTGRPKVEIYISDCDEI